MHDQNKDFIVTFVLKSCLAESVHFLQELNNPLLHHIVFGLEHQLEKLAHDVFNF